MVCVYICVCAASLSWFPSRFVWMWFLGGHFLLQFSDGLFVLVVLALHVRVHVHVHVHVHVLHVCVRVLHFKRAVGCTVQTFPLNFLVTHFFICFTATLFYSLLQRICTCMCMCMCICQWWMVGALVVADGFSVVSLCRPFLKKWWSIIPRCLPTLCWACVCCWWALRSSSLPSTNTSVSLCGISSTYFMCTRVGAWKRKEMPSLLEGALLEKGVLSHQFVVLRTSMTLPEQGLHICCYSLWPRLSLAWQPPPYPVRASAIMIK